MSNDRRSQQNLAAQCWRSAAGLVAGLSLALVFLAAAIDELGHGHPSWMLPAAGWGLVMGAVLSLESARARP